MRVRAVDLAGNIDLTPETRNFVLDATPPETTIDSGPGSRTNDTEPAFAFSSSEPTNATFECALDAGAWEACDSGAYTAAVLADGEHTFKVRATDEAGNVDPTPASSTFTVDTVAPVATITDGPAADARINNTQPAFEFESDKAASVFQCRFNEVNEAPAAWDTCSTGFQPASALDDGDYTFEVQAIDDVGNVSTAPATSNFTVDTVAPTTTINVGPAEASTIDTDSTFFEFASSEANSTFDCSLETTGDPDDFQSCDVPFEANGLDDGDYTFKVKATDVAGNQDSVGDVRNFSVDSPPNTTILPSSDVADGGKTKNTTPNFEFESNENDATFECRVDSGDENAWAVCTSPFTTSFLADGEHTFEVRAVDLAARPDLTPAKATFTVDTVLPETSFTGGPGNGDLTNNASPEFSFESSKPNSTFVCDVDGGGFSACTSPTTIGPLSDGDHTFSIKAIDEVTNEETPAKEVTFTVDTVAPVTTITVPTEAEAFTTNQPELEFTASEAVTFACVIDGGAPVACESPFETDELDDGAHTVTITATDLAGNVEVAPLTRNFTTEAPPRVTITSGIADGGLSNQTTQAFECEASEVDATFECRVDSNLPGDWAVCTSGIELTGLTEGSHTFEVRALAFDPPNDPSLKPAKVTFEIDLTKPTSSITAGPAGGSTITSSSTSLSFESTDGGTSFECRVDSDAFDACVSPKSLTGLGDGSHTFQVRATDDAGNVEDPVTSRTFSVDTTTPVTTITSGPAPGATIGNSTPDFAFTSSESGTFDCKVDGGSFSACTSPFTPAALSDGSHTVTIRSTDDNGLVEAAPPSRTFTVDTVAPNVNITSGPNGLTGDSTPSFAFTASEAATFECATDAGAFSACTSAYTTASLSDGDHAVHIRATDGAGNVSAVASRSFKVDATAPTVTITKAPAPAAGETTASAEFSSSENGSTFACALDGGAFSACTSPKSLTGLSVGSHTFQVKATDSAGNESAPVSAAFEVTSVVVEPGPGVLTNPKIKAKKKVRRGKALKIKVVTRNVGESDLDNVKVCIKTPRRLVKGKGKRCKSIGHISPGGGAGKAVFKVKAKKSKRLRGKKIKVKAIVTGDGKTRHRGHVTVLK
ncbi:MAG: Ig-like domain repeat protein [Solirubrobacterales bacterium]|nr:Ig-like domain repeat protein [Solirubrobacterales bacterium]